MQRQLNMLNDDEFKMFVKKLKKSQQHSHLLKDMPRETFSTEFNSHSFTQSNNEMRSHSVLKPN